MWYTFSKQVDWNELLERKQNIINKANIKENSKRRSFDYTEGDLIIILHKQGHNDKLDLSTFPEGPWKITQIHTNGTVPILRNNYIERINIRRIRPFFE